MKLGRNWRWLVIAVVLVGNPGAQAFAESTQLERQPASKVATSKSSAKKKKKKKSVKKTAKAKSHAKSKAKPSQAQKKHKGDSARSHYPTQPGGSGFADMPNEKKDDLPPAQNPEAEQ